MPRSPLLRFIIRRMVGLVVALVLVSLASFMMIHLVPGDPARQRLPLTATQEAVDVTRHQMGLDKPLVAQFGDFVDGLVHGDLGVSYTSQQPVSQIIGDRFPRTAELASAALLLTLVLAVPLGIAFGAVTANGRRKGLELAFNGFTGMVAAIPDYMIAVLLVFMLAYAVPIFPIAGATDGLRSLFLPALSIALAPTVILARIVRVETHNVLAQDYTRTARSKRLPARLIYARHALPNLLTATMTIGGLLFASLIGGSIIVENVFAWPGLGLAVVQAIQVHDYPLIQGIVLLLGTAVIVINALVDITLAAIDPRTTIAGAA